MSWMSVMDHYFQMEHGRRRPSDPMLEGYTTLGFLAGATPHGAARHAGDRRDLPPSRAAGQDRHHPRRAVRRPGRARHRRRLVRARAPRRWACRSRRSPSASSASRRRCRSACRCGTPDDDGPYEGKHYQLAETLCVPPPMPHAAPADPDRRRRREEDPAAGGPVRGRLQPLRRDARGGRAQARRAARALRRRRPRVRPTSRRRSPTRAIRGARPNSTPSPGSWRATPSSASRP